MYAIPLIGIGTYRLKKDDIENVIPTAIKAGYRQIDTAALYKNEKYIGEVLKKNSIDRDKIWITTKVDRFSIRDGNTDKIIQDSLKKLDTKYLDCVLLHAPVNEEKDITAWKVLEEYYRQGIIKNIGVSNYKEEQLENILKNCDVRPYTNQIELSPFCTRQKLVEYCKNNKIIITGHSSLTKAERLNEEKIVVVAKKYNVSSAQVLLQWSKQNGYVVLPRSSKKEHVIENIDCDFKIDDDDINDLNSLDCNWGTHPDYL